MNTHTELDQTDYSQGYSDGYNGDPRASTNSKYLAGYSAGALDWDLSREEEEESYYVEEYMWDAVSQGMYDDDPSPYNGDYSEM